MSFDKEEYWKNRQDGKRGQGDSRSIVQMADKVIPKDAAVGFDNDGNMVLKNRKYRRRSYKLPTEKKLKSKRKKK